MRWIRIVLWSLLTVLLAVVGYDILWACGTRPLNLLGRDLCPVPLDYSPIAREAERGELIQRQIHQAELEIAQKPPCSICRQVTSTTAPQFAVLIDGSRSMLAPLEPNNPGAGTRMQVVKGIVGPAVGRTRLRRITYAQFLGCASNEISSEEVTPAQALQRIQRLPERDEDWPSVSSGGTAIAATLERVAATFRSDRDGRFRGSIVVVSDGEENCGSSDAAVRVAEEIARTKPGIKINVIDLAGDNENARIQNEAMVRPSGGRVWRRGVNLDIDANVVASLPDQRDVCEQF